MIGIVSTACKLFKTVGLLAVRLHLAKLRSKNWKEKSYFWLKCESRFFDQNQKPIFSPQKFSFLAAVTKIFVRSMNAIPRWAFSLIPNPLALKTENVQFLIYFCKKHYSPRGFWFPSSCRSAITFSLSFWLFCFPHVALSWVRIQKSGRHYFAIMQAKRFPMNKWIVIKKILALMWAKKKE